MRPPFHRAPQRPGQRGPERRLGDVVVELGRRPGIEGDAGEQQRACSGTLRTHHVAAEQEGEQEGGRDEELRDDIGGPADGAGQDTARLQHPARQRRVLVGRDHPLAAPHVALDHVERRGAVRQRGRQRPGRRSGQRREAPRGRSDCAGSVRRAGSRAGADRAEVEQHRAPQRSAHSWQNDRVSAMRRCCRLCAV